MVKDGRLLVLALLLVGFAFTPILGAPSSIAATTQDHRSSTTSLTVLSYYSTGPQIQGMYIVLESSHGSVISTGYTPITFTVTPGTQYLVQADSYRSIVFSYWSQPQNPVTNPISEELASGVQYTLIAYYGGYVSSSSSSSSSLSSISSSSSSSSTSTTSTSTSTSTSSTTLSTTSMSSPLGLIVPLYEYPDQDWTTLENAARAQPSVPVEAIINPSNGPGSSTDPTIQNGVKALQQAGITVTGYIDTKEASVSVSQVETQMNEYKTWYGVSGAFLDDYPSSGSLSYYSTLTTYAHSIGLTTTGNPGWEVPASNVATTDGMMIYETSGLPSASYLQGADMGYPGSHFSFIATSVSSLPSQSYFDSVAPYVGYVWVTNQGASYMNLPSYLTQEMAELAAT